MISEADINITLFLLPVYQLLFFSILLSSFDPKRNKQKFFIGILLIILTFFLACNAIYYIGYQIIFRYCFIVYLPLILLVIPVYYLYLNSLSGINNPLNFRKIIILFLPSVSVLLINTVVFFSVPESRLFIYLSKISSLSNPISRLLHQVQIIGVGVLLPVQILFLIRKYFIVMKLTKNNISNNPQTLSYFNIQWAQIFLTGILIFIISNIVFFFISDKTIITFAVYNLLMLLSGGIIGYLGMKQDSLYNQVSKIKITYGNNRQLSGKKDKKNGNSEINDNQVEFIKNLREFLATEKIYLNKNLSTSDLAKELGISTRELSNIINNLMKTNFHGLINEYRVMEAKEMLRRKEYMNLKIEVISNKAGFRSKSSFNACFKTITGKTPSEYRNDFFKH